MRIINLSYNTNNQYHDPDIWLRRIAFFTGILKSLAEFNDVISIHFIDYEGILRIDKVSNHFLRYRRWQLWLPIGFHRYLKRFHPDVVIVHGLIFPWQIILLRCQLGRATRIVVQHHAERPLRWHRKYFQRKADSYVKAYLFASAELGRLWVDKGLIRSASKIREVIGASSPFTPMDRKPARLVTGVAGKPVFIWVGRLDKNKDPVTVVNAFRHFLTNHYQSSLYMIFQTGELLEALKAIISKYPDTEKAIHLMGKVDYHDLHYWYNSADFIISGSHYEGSGIAVCEAMSCGCIPVVTDIPSFRMMTRQGECGMLYPPGDTDLLLAALTKSAEIDIETMKSKVLQQFNNKLSFAANAREYYDIFSAP